MARNSLRLLSSKNLRALVSACVFALAPAAFADDHIDHLKMMLSMASKHAAVLPQPSYAIAPNAVKTFNITARSWEFVISPSPFVVNEGDLVTINISVPANDPSTVGHGILMESYIETAANVAKGQTRTITFTATTAGTFAFICTQSSCGDGHTSMFGQLVVNRVVSVNSIAPATGSTSGGTAITLTGSLFQSGATVTVGGQFATNVNVVNATTITALSPVGPAGDLSIPQDIVVRNPDGTSSTKSGAFVYTKAALAVTAVTPTQSFAGTVVTIRGEGFTTTQPVSVSFGGAAATNVRIIDAVTMQATVPFHANGAVDVVVTNGSSSATKAAAFTYGAPPARHRSARH